MMASLNRDAEYSGWGNEVSVCAPSDNYYPMDQHRYVPGLRVWTIDNEESGPGLSP